MTTHARIDSPIGPLTLVADDGALTGLYMENGRHLPETFGARDDDALPDLVAELDLEDRAAAADLAVGKARHALEQAQTRRDVLERLGRPLHLRRLQVELTKARAGAAAGKQAFERAVTIAASIVHSADRAGLTTRFVTSDGVDIRGPDVAAQTLHLLARIAINTEPTVPVERDPGEGLGGERLGQAGDRLEQAVAAGEEADEQPLEQAALADDHAAQLEEDALHLLGGAHVVHRWGVESGHRCGPLLVVVMSSLRARPRARVPCPSPVGRS